VTGTVAREKEEGEEMIERYARKGLMRAIILAGALASALAFTAPAMAATAAPAHPAATVAVAGAGPAGFTVKATTTGHFTTTRVSAATYCGTTPVDEVNGTYYGILVWWVKMQTKFCWNGSKVTSHSTSVSHWTGYTFEGAPLSASCSPGCREVSESISNNPMFIYVNGSVVYAWNVHLWQNEFYNGTWNAGWSSTGYAF
jgi:hypothetical protein